MSPSAYNVLQCHVQYNLLLTTVCENKHTQKKSYTVLFSDTWSTKGIIIIHISEQYKVVQACDWVQENTEILFLGYHGSMHHPTASWEGQK